jgi:hypothetical protein
MATDLPEELIGRAQAAQRLCDAVARELSRRADHKQTVQAVITGSNNAIGIAALAATFLVPAAAWADSGVARLVTLVSAIALLVIPYLQLAALRNPASRYADFSKYIGAYSHKVQEIVADVKSPRRYERLMEVLALADANLNDVRVTWPNLMNQMDPGAGMAQPR